MRATTRLAFTISMLMLAAVALATVPTSRAAGITVTAELLPSETSELAFHLRLDTHGGDLMPIDLAGSATLHDGAGAPVSGRFAWYGESESSHHRSGVLRLALDAPGLPPQPLRLTLHDIGVPERVFEFEAVAPGSGPDEAAERLRDRTYVPTIADGAIAAIDTSTFELAWTLAVSIGTDDRAAESAMGIAVSPDGNLVFAGDAATRELVVVDARRREEIARVPVGHGVHAIDLAPDGRTLWVDGSLDGFPWLSATSVVDTTTLEVVRTLTPALGSASHLAFTPDGSEVWAPSVSSNLAWVWDADTGAVIAGIPLTLAPFSAGSPEAERGQIGFNEIAIAPDGSRAYAVGPEAAIVFAIDVATREVVGTVQAGERAHGIAVSPDGTELWTANRNGSVSIIDAYGLELLETLHLGGYANHVAFARDGLHALVSRADDVAVIDVVSRLIVREIPVGEGPHEFSGEPGRSPPR